MLHAVANNCRNNVPFQTDGIEIEEEQIDKEKDTMKNDPKMDNGGLLIIVKIQNYLYQRKYREKYEKKINATKDCK